MTGSDITQINNAANDGDITKHFVHTLILQRLARMDGPLLYVETHAFRPVVVIDSRRVERWGERARLLLRSQGEPYESIQHPYLERNEYLCSAGIADHLLTGRPEGATGFILCEKAADSRIMLENHGWRSATPVILQDNAKLPAELESSSGRYSAVFALIDPYGLTRVESSLFAQWLARLDAAAARQAPMLALVFNWREESWPVVDGYTRVSCLSASYLKKGSPWLKLSIYANTHGLALVAGLLEDLRK
ncbi:MAG: hypothetical protein OEZ32_12970 [Nitrospinota bacterium]|nr:hypothetical protein [Nitrospinota bacterium]